MVVATPQLVPPKLPIRGGSVRRRFLEAACPSTCRLPLRIWTLLVCGVVVCFGVRPSWADLLELRNGRNIEGVVEVLEDGRYRVTLDVGRSVTLEANEVLNQIARPAPLEIFRKRIDQVDRSDRDALEKLAIWSEDHGLARSVEKVYKMLLAVDPHHEGARRELGYVLHKNRWWPKKEVQGLGLKLFRGRWLTADEIQRVEEEAAVREFEVLLQDLNSENTYLSRNARVRILEEKNPRLAAYAKKMLGDEEPINRMFAGVVLSNIGFEVGGRAIYDALRNESRDEVREALCALMRKMRNPQVVRWAARDLPAALRARRSTIEARGLLKLLEVCPHEWGVPALIAATREPQWRQAADRVLTEIFQVESRGPSEWDAIWQNQRGRLRGDLGSGWLSGRRNKKRNR